MTASAVCRPALSTMLNAMWSVPYWKTRVNNPKTTRQPPHSAQRGCVAPIRRASSLSRRVRPGVIDNVLSTK